MRHYLEKKKITKKGLVEWVKWQSTCLASMTSNPSTTKKKKKKKRKREKLL
jgi:hypothetical protein